MRILLPENVRQALQKSGLYLLVVFTGLILAVKLGLVSTGLINFTWFAIFVGLLGITFRPSINKQLDMPQWVLLPAFGIAILLRSWPYFENMVPLGYDPGLYKFVFEHPFNEAWISAAYPLPFTLLMAALNRIFGSQFVLTWLFVILSAATCFAVFWATRRLLGRQIALLASLIFITSLIQYETFTFNYYKNTFGIILLLIALSYFETRGGLNWGLIISGALIAGFHTPALFLFATSYMIWVGLGFRGWQLPQRRLAILNGLLIIGGSLLVNFDRVGSLLLPRLLTTAQSFVDFSGAGGSFPGWQYFAPHTAFTVAFAIVGLGSYWKAAKPIYIAAGVAAFIVIFGLFFHNRMIIYLDALLIPLAAAGLYTLISHKSMLGKLVATSLLFASLVTVAARATSVQPLISAEEFEAIAQIDQVVENGASIIASDGRYSPWLKGWVPRRIIAPGLFDPADSLTEEEWTDLLEGYDLKGLLARFEGPLYLHVGNTQPPLGFIPDCLELLDLPGTSLYRVQCHETDN